VASVAPGVPGGSGGSVHNTDGDLYKSQGEYIDGMRGNKKGKGKSDNAQSQLSSGSSSVGDESSPIFGESKGKGKEKATEREDAPKRPSTPTSSIGENLADGYLLNRDDEMAAAVREIDKVYDSNAHNSAGPSMPRMSLSEREEAEKGGWLPAGNEIPEWLRKLGESEDNEPTDRTRNDAGNPLGGPPPE
jgi:hypothetical protein